MMSKEKNQSKTYQQLVDDLNSELGVISHVQEPDAQLLSLQQNILEATRALPQNDPQPTLVAQPAINASGRWWRSKLLGAACAIALVASVSLFMFANIDGTLSENGPQMVVSGESFSESSLEQSDLTFQELWLDEDQWLFSGVL